VTEKYILEDRLDELSDYIETREAGMQSFDQHILSIYRQDLISGTEAMRWSSRPEALAMAMRGVVAGGAKTAELK
jgi:twitching motility protein PilT